MGLDIRVGEDQIPCGNQRPQDSEFDFITLPIIILILLEKLFPTGDMPPPRIQRHWIQ